MSTSATAVTLDTRLPRGAWIAFVILGALSVGAGILALVYPGITLAVITVIVGINLIAMSIYDLLDGQSENGTAGTLVAILGLIAGVIILRQPGHSLLVIVVTTGLYLIVVGVLGCVRAMQALTSDRAARMLVGIATATMGILIVAIPSLGLATLAALAGIGLIFRGCGALAAGLALRRISA